jgi:hypothetical protein
LLEQQKLLTLLKFALPDQQMSQVEEGKRWRRCRVILLESHSLVLAFAWPDGREERILAGTSATSDRL